MEMEKAQNQNKEEKKVFSNNKQKLSFNYEMLETKLRELRYYEAIYVPGRHLAAIEKFLTERGYKIETVIDNGEIKIKYISSKDSEIYLIEGQNEGWLLNNCNVLLKVSRSKKYIYVFKALSAIKYKYHLGELIYEGEKIS